MIPGPGSHCPPLQCLSSDEDGGEAKTCKSEWTSSIGLAGLEDERSFHLFEMSQRPAIRQVGRRPNTFIWMLHGAADPTY